MLPLSAGDPFAPKWGRPGVTARPRPTRALTGLRGDAAITSPNWSGFVDTGGSAQFTGVSASWVVPSVPTGNTADSATWAGIDGYDNRYLVQAGTDQSDGKYFVWYELLPQVAFSLGNVEAGDRVDVTISQVQAATWQITISDVTSGVTWAGPVAYTSPGTSAEWVEEAPTQASNNQIEHLADYGAVHFDNLAVQGANLSAATLQPVVLVAPSNGDVLSYPSPYDPLTDSFVATFGSPVGGLTGLPPYPSTGLSPPGGTGSSTSATTTSASTTTTSVAAAAPSHGYWLVGADGGVFAFGDARYYGRPAPATTHDPVVGIAATPDHLGYWVASADGGVFAFGDAQYGGSLPGLGIGGPRPSARGRHLAAPIVGIAASPTAGYWLAASDGAIFSFGGAHFYGSCTATPLPACVGSTVALVPDPTGSGYWLLMADGDMVGFGSVPSVGDGDCQRLARQENVLAAGATATPDGKGYWVVLSDGSTCAEGDAVKYGIWEADEVTDARDPAVALMPDQQGQGAWTALAKGQVDRYGNAPRLGDLGRAKLAGKIVGGTAF